MKRLTDRFRQDHEDILRALVDAKQKQVSTPDGFIKLREAMDRLLDHVESEDRNFYPVLRRAAGDDTKLHTMLDLFETEMKDVTGKVHAFRERYTDDCSSMDCITEFGTIFMLVRNRMAKEENVLFPEFETLPTDSL